MKDITLKVLSFKVNDLNTEGLSLSNIVYYNKEDIPYDSCYLKIKPSDKKSVTSHIFNATGIEKRINVPKGHIILNLTQRISTKCTKNKEVTCEVLNKYKDVPKNFNNLYIEGVQIIKYNILYVIEVKKVCLTLKVKKPN
jgi:D-lyxose ketol-isomerase